MKFKTRMIVTFSALITAAFAVLMSLVYLTVSHANQQLVSLHQRPAVRCQSPRSRRLAGPACQRTGNHRAQPGGAVDGL